MCKCCLIPHLKAEQEREEELLGVLEIRHLSEKKSSFPWVVQLFIINVTGRIKGWIVPTWGYSSKCIYMREPGQKTFHPA